MKRNTESFKKELAKINPNIEVLGEYVKVHQKVLYRCKICGHEWSAEPNSVLHGIGCPECGKKKSINSRKTGIDKFKQQLKEKNSTVEYYSGEYKNTDTKLFFKCLKCGNIWEATPHSVLSARLRSENGNGCPKCKGMNCSIQKTRTHKQFIEELQKVNPNIDILSEYIKDKEYVSCKCKVCGYEWKSTPGHLLDRHGCPSCSKSIGEKLVSEWLNSHNIQYKTQVKIECDSLARNTNFVFIDFIIESMKGIFYIEYNGKQHYEYIPYLHNGSKLEFEKQIRRDNEVRKYCIKNNIQLIEIPYTVTNITDLDKYLNIVLND